MEICFDYVLEDWLKETYGYVVVFHEQKFSIVVDNLISLQKEKARVRRDIHEKINNITTRNSKRKKASI